MHEPLPTRQSTLVRIERAVFAVRWILVLPYLGLVAALGMYIAHMIHEVVEMARHYEEQVTQQNVLLLFGLELLDMTLIAQLFVMTIQGGYSIFIHPLDKAGFDLPQWIRHGLSTSDQKIKFGMSIINIMIVQLLDMFIKLMDPEQTPAMLARIQNQILPMREQIFGCAVVATLSFCVFNIMMHPEMLRKKPEPDEHGTAGHEDPARDSIPAPATPAAGGTHQEHRA